MTFQVNPKLAVLFGSETRSKVLGFLADAREPKTGYQVAKAIGIKPPKVYRELGRLAEKEFLSRVEEGGRRLFVLVNDDLRKLVLKYSRITSEDEWFSAERLRDRRDALDRAARIHVRLPASKPNPEGVPNPWEYERPRVKDRALRRIARRSPRRK